MKKVNKPYCCGPKWSNHKLKKKMVCSDTEKRHEKRLFKIREFPNEQFANVISYRSMGKK